jgi:uncharacterized protein YkwD
MPVIPHDLAAVTRGHAALLGLVNAQRQQLGLAALAGDARLAAAAIGQAFDCASRNLLTHAGSDGSASADRIARMGLDFAAEGETAAEGQLTPEDAVSAWMQSPEHRAILTGDFRLFGAAFADRDDAGRLTRYWIADFATPAPAS